MTNLRLPDAWDSGYSNRARRTVSRRPAHQQAGYRGEWFGRRFSRLLVLIRFVAFPSLAGIQRRCLALRFPLLAAWLCLSSLAQAAAPFDLVIQHGRVIDPETQLDAIRSVGIRGGQIVAISEQPLNAEQVIDATGLVVSPGFINLHSHSAAEPGYRLELLDGVTTVLELEAGTFPIARFGQQLGDAPLTHFGASVGHAWIRMLVIDPQALTQLVVNLLTNALKFSPDGQAVDLEARRVDGDRLRISVIDRGRGMTEAEVAHMFDPFWQSKGTISSGTRGTTSGGLGLHICRQLVEAQSGECTVTSALGRGTTVTVILPTRPVDESVPDSPGAARTPAEVSA